MVPEPLRADISLQPDVKKMDPEEPSFLTNSR